MPKKISRRNFIAGTSAAVTAAVSLPLASTAKEQWPGFGETVETPGKPFMDQYYDGITEIVKGIKDTQLDNIANAMQKAYECRSKNGNIYSNVVYGHYSGYAGARDVPGQPNILPQYNPLPKETVDAMKSGDFLLTHVVDENYKKARERGVFVAGITNNYFKFYKTPPEGLREDKMKMSVEEMSDMVIDSYVPWDNGLVAAPQIPRFKLCPSTGISQFAVYWACTASLASLIGSKGKGDPKESAEKYLKLVLDRFALVGTDRPKVDAVAKKMADIVLSRKPKFYVYGEPFTVSDTKTGNMFISEACGAASGPMICEGYVAENVKEGDIILIGSLRSNSPKEIEVAKTAKSKGAYTVAFCPFATDRDSSGSRLFKEVDDAFNTYSDESSGVLAIPGFKEKVCPISGMTGNLVLWLILAQWTDQMARRGEMPYYWQGFHENGGRDYDNAVRPYFLKRGY